ncbi:MAG: hypothetical protein H6Q68_3625 [Firmicutes bacterium]|nr:hypothetical protein [Bacillota bacterium]
MSEQEKLWQPPVPPVKNENEDMMKQMAARLGNIKRADSIKPRITMEILEKLLGEDNLAGQDGEQKYYILPDQEALEKLLDNLPSAVTGEYSQSQWWKQTDVQVGSEQDSLLAQMAERIQSVEERLQQIENIVKATIQTSVK